MKTVKLLSCLAMFTLLSACSAPAPRPQKDESVVDVINRAEAARSAGEGQCPGGTVPICTSVLRIEAPVCSCGNPFGTGPR